MRKFLNRSLWVSLYLLFPVTLIGLFAQNAIPGEFLYPVKLGMENVGAYVFSLTPEAKASYDSTLTQRRFDEAQKLITYKANTSGLDTLVVQATKTQESVDNIKDQKQKEVLQEKLINDINDYQERLTQTQQKLDPTYIPPTPTPTSTLHVTPKPTTPLRIFPTKIYQPPNNSRQNPSERTAIPTATPAPDNTPTSHQTPPDIVDNIEQTKEKLEEIKQQVQFQSIQMTTPQPTPTQPPATPTPFVLPSPTVPLNPSLPILNTPQQEHDNPEISKPPRTDEPKPHEAD